MHELHVGQKLWYVPNDRRTAHEVTIAKVGRKWATTDRACRPERIDLETLIVDGRGYSSPGRCYLSREAYEARQALLNEWSRIRSLISGMYSGPPEGVTIQDIEAAKELLKI